MPHLRLPSHRHLAFAEVLAPLAILQAAALVSEQAILHEYPGLRRLEPFEAADELPPTVFASLLLARIVALTDMIAYYQAAVGAPVGTSEATDSPGREY